jgi:hypothetical protein
MLPVVSTRSGAIPSERKRSASWAEAARRRVIPAVTKRPAIGKRARREKLRSEIRAFMHRTGTPRLEAWRRCSGQRSPSVLMARSGRIASQARAEKGAQSSGKYAAAATSLGYRSTATR